MDGSSLEPVFVYLCTLSESAKRQIGTSFDPESKFFPLKRWAPFQHWALCIHDRCYEVTSIDTPVHSGKEYKMKVSDTAEWRKLRRSLGLRIQSIKVGATVWSAATIEAQANDIYATRFNEGYELGWSNCQNFVRVLYRAIALNEKDERVSLRERDSWKSMPMNATKVITLAEKAGGVCTALFTLAVADRMAPDATKDPIFCVAVLIIGYGPFWWHKSKDGYYFKKMKHGHSFAFESREHLPPVPTPRTPRKVLPTERPQLPREPQKFQKRWFCPDSTCPQSRVRSGSGWPLSGDCLLHIQNYHRGDSNFVAETASTSSVSDNSGSQVDNEIDSELRYEPIEPRYALITRTVVQKQRRFLCSDNNCPFSSGKFSGWTRIAECEQHIRTVHKEEPGKDPRFRNSELFSGHTRVTLQSDLSPKNKSGVRDRFISAVRETASTVERDTRSLRYGGLRALDMYCEWWERKTRS